MPEPIDFALLFKQAPKELHVIYNNLLNDDGLWQMEDEYFKLIIFTYFYGFFLNLNFSNIEAIMNLFQWTRDKVIKNLKRLSESAIGKMMMVKVPIEENETTETTEIGAENADTQTSSK